MVLAVIYGLLAFAPAPAPGTAPDPKAQMLQMFGTLAFMAVAMYLLMFRPQQKKAREHAELLKGLRAGDKVVTSGGIVGVVVTASKDKSSVLIRSNDTKLEVLKSSINDITERAAASES